MVRKAVDSLPPDIHAAMANIALVIEDEPSEELRDEDDDGPLGLYEGIPLIHRTSEYGFVLPDKVTIYRGPHERATNTPNELFGKILETVIQEYIHHFGREDWEIEGRWYE